jgi:hypothetical protein
MSQVQKNVIHYDRPIAHSQTQTRWLIPRGSSVSSVSMKLLDLKLNPDVSCYFSALIGIYGCVERLQLRINKKEIDYYFSPEALPYILASSADNEGQKNIFSVLHNTGNNVSYDITSKLLTFERAVVDTTTCEIRLALLSNFLQVVGVIDDEIEIIVDWNTNIQKYLLPVNALDVVSQVSIQAPYLSYETLEGTNLKQPSKFIFHELVPDVWSIPALSTGQSQSVTVRSNAFNQKTINRLMLANVPSTIQNRTPNPDSKALFSLFGSYMSVPMSQEVLNISIDGNNILSFRNVSNDAIKLSLAVDSFGVYPHAVSLGHVHSKTPVVDELFVDIAPPIAPGNPQLNGFFSYGIVDIYQRVNKELALVYQRTAPDNTTYPTLGEQLQMYAIGEVQCAFVDGQKVYV